MVFWGEIKGLKRAKDVQGFVKNLTKDVIKCFIIKLNFQYISDVKLLKELKTTIFEVKATSDRSTEISV
jgi:hypothetical protein